MSHKLPVEKKLIRGKIAKREYCGRHLRSTYDVATEVVTHYHATKGYRKRKA